MVIAQRILKFDVDGREIDVPVTIHLPVEKGDHWQCDYQIGWPGSQRVSQARGIDSMQSLLMAMHKIGAEIYTSNAHKAGKLKWHLTGGGYGFPLSKRLHDLREGEDNEM